MGSQSSFIVSDLHLGSEFFYQREFFSWLDRLPVEAQLVLNGDIVDDCRKALPPEHLAVLERLVEESNRRSLIWVRGNHDLELILEDAGSIQFVHRWQIEPGLLVVHGDNLDDVMPRHRLFKGLFRRLHRLLILLGARRVHVAEYAKKWGLFYRVLNEHMIRNALRTARELGVAAICCGHTHAAMDVQRDGYRYLNTGAWTEKPLHYLLVEGESICLKIYGDGES